MRDALLALFLLSAFPMVIYRYQVGAMVIGLLSFMYPQSNTYAFALTTPWLDYFVVLTFAGYFLRQGYKEYKHHPLITLVIILYIWTCLSTYFSFDINFSYEPWFKFTKILILALIVYATCLNERRLKTFMKIMVISVGFYGIKGGIFTILSGGSFHVLGPPNSFFEGNNEMALVLVMTLPFMIFFIKNADNLYQRHFAIFCSLCTAIAVLGTQSRTGFTALIIGGLYFLWLEKKFLKPAFFLIPVISVALFFMPDSWTDRMATTTDVETDSSFQGRVDMWEATIRIANDYPIIGGGFEVIYVPEIIVRYIPPDVTSRAIHSAYFQMIAEHGYIGLIIFLILLYSIFKSSWRLYKLGKEHHELAWLSDLSISTRASIASYFVLAVTTNIAFYDLLYFIIFIVAMAEVIAVKKIQPQKFSPHSKFAVAE